MSYAGFCEKCGVPYYESDRLAHEHKTAEPAVVSASPTFNYRPMGNCFHCGKPIYDNGTVAVHLIATGKMTVASQWCDPENRTGWAETEMMAKMHKPAAAQPVAADQTKVEEAVKAHWKKRLLHNVPDLKPHEVEKLMDDAADDIQSWVDFLRSFFPVSQTPTHLNSLRCLGDKLRMNLKDAATLAPEHFNIEGVNQLIAEWDAVVTEIVKEMCAVATVSGNGPSEIESDFRRYMWLNHGHPEGLYGDDGEMQCNHRDCLIDFKRNPLPFIHKKLGELALKKLSVSGNGPEPLEYFDIPFCESPCGHSSQYAWSEDGGKNIVCLVCEYEAGAASHNGQRWVRVEDRLPSNIRMVEVAALRVNGEQMRDYSWHSPTHGWTDIEDQGFKKPPTVYAWRDLLPLPAPPSEANVPRPIQEEKK